MEIQLRALSSIVVLLILILGVVLFKHLGLLKEEHGQVCTTLVTKVTLPALIFMSLIHTDLKWEQSILIVLLMSVSLVCLGLGWCIARAFRLDGPAMAPVILTSGFSSSSVLGVALISELFPDNKQAVVDTVIISGLGMAPLVFTLGTMIAQYYGENAATVKERRMAALAYFHSPIFIAVVSGLALSNLIVHDNSILHSIIDGLRIVSAGNTILVLLSVGLLLQLQNLKGVLALAACVAFVNLIVMPLLISLPAHTMDLAHWEIEVLMLEGAMPALMVPAVLCDAYGADGRLAAKLVLTTLTASVFTIPAIYLLRGLL